MLIKNNRIFLFFIMFVFVLSGCQTSTKEEREESSRQSETSNPAPATNNPSTNNPSPTPPANAPQTPNKPTNNPNTPSPATPSQNPLDQYGVTGLVNDFNTVVGNSVNITMSDPQLYNDDAETATFSITMSNGSGVGIVIVKSSLKVRAISVISPAKNDEEYEAFFTTTLAFLRYIDQNLAKEELANILVTLGYGTPMSSVNHSYESSDLQIHTEYNAQTAELNLDILYVNN